MNNEKSKYFKGFSKETIEFLRELKQNNNKAWFEENKDNYKKLLLTPLQYLVMDMSQYILSIDPLMEVTPSAGKTISRIYRDTRFSKDKSPYKDTMWITFKRPSKNWSSSPAFFFEISPNSYRYGMGFFSADPHTMELFRGKIDASLEKFKKAVSFYSKQNTFVLEGDRYKKILDKGKPEDILDWYQRKSLYLVNNKNIDDTLFKEELVTELKTNFALLAEFYHYLYSIKEF
ncbi:DUF2461 domain-containing protein [Clostridium sp. 19966]|uniref:DUF2461 domain-containing protein n=1 Tax=Clostridium sp. 19966 TaxID=2768166 RepID=UPI0028DD6AA5|nr:DUF2461 domain-containing protein [Clostridium sp. 19966]MDT8717715.1 DUF2461 domain-containing protein [Clostridium sp. 19966]